MTRNHRGPSHLNIQSEMGSLLDRDPDSSLRGSGGVAVPYDTRISALLNAPCLCLDKIATNGIVGHPSS